jgi:hypothetical protein
MLCLKSKHGFRAVEQILVVQGCLSTRNCQIIVSMCLCVLAVILCVVLLLLLAGACLEAA